MVDTDIDTVNLAAYRYSRLVDVVACRSGGPQRKQSAETALWMWMTEVTEGSG